MMTTVKIKSYQALNLAIQTSVWKQIRLLGAAPLIPRNQKYRKGIPFCCEKAQQTEERSFKE